MDKTNFVIVVDYSEDDNYLEDSYLLGWNNNYDWWDTETIGDDLINIDGTIRENDFGLIKVDRWTMVYASDERSLTDLQDRCKGANKEDLNCTVCRIEEDSEGQWIVVPV